MNVSNMDLTRFFELSIDMLCIAGKDGYFKRINHAFISTLGYDEQTLLKTPFIEFVHPDDVSNTLAEMEKLETGIPTLYFENRYLCKNGEYKWFAWTAHPVDEILYCVARDISDQKELQIEVVESKNRFQAILEMASVGIIAVNQRGQIVLSNPKAREMFGYDEAEFRGASVEMLLPSRFSENHRAYRQAFHESPVARPMGLKSDLYGYHKDGYEFPLEVSLSFAELESGTLAMAFVVDIRDRREAELEKERLIDDLEAFAYTVAHDLKSPLGLILGYADLLESSLHDYSTEQIQDGLGVIRKMSTKMNDIIHALLMLATVRNKEKIEVNPINMQAVVLEAKARLAHMIEEHDASISMPTSWPIVRGYAPWIEEVWINYLSNAIKYGGLPPHIQIGGTLEDGMVRYWVRDNGKGLTPTEQMHLFTPFTRLNLNETRGHGLGLSIVKRIIEKLGGQVGVESRPGSGSTFYFLLPSG